MKGFQSFFTIGPNPSTMTTMCMDLKTSQVDVHGDRMCGANVKLEVEPILLFSFYIWYWTREGVDFLCRALTKSQGITPLRLVGMDKNGHSLIWELVEVELEKVGETVEDVLDEGGLLVANHRDSPASFLGNRGQTSWIEVTIASQALARRIID